MTTQQATDDTQIESVQDGTRRSALSRRRREALQQAVRREPDYVRLVGSTEEVSRRSTDAVTEGRRLVVTSGGHCLEGFVSDPDVRVIIDVSPMKRIYYDAEMRAIAVEAGATVGETFRALSEQWGVVIPLGEYPAIGMGGHVAGGAFGFLCRQLGLAADYLYAVEVVTVDESGQRGQRRRDARDRPTRIASSGGRIPARAAATSASSRATGSDRPTRRATIPPRCCRARRSRSRRSRRNGTGATSIEPRSSDSFGITELVRAKQRRRFAECIALDAPRDSSQAVRKDRRPRREHRRRAAPSSRWMAIWRR